MKRGLLIAGGTLGGLGAVMSITPPQLSSTSSLTMGDMAAVSGAAAAPSQAPAASTSSSAAPAQSATATKPAATKKATNKPATKATTNSNTNSNTNSVAATTNPTPAAVATTAAPAGVNGTFTGPSIFVQYGNVQVQITVVNGRITDAKAVVAPSGKNDRYTNMAVPVLKKQTLAAQSANIQGVSGASYTSYGWYTSLQGALTKAGL
jgi:uncharacterized protein with FMN-binding domain